jgi:hypothetical protein
MTVSSSNASHHKGHLTYQQTVTHKDLKGHKGACDDVRARAVHAIDDIWIVLRVDEADGRRLRGRPERDGDDSEHDDRVGERDVSSHAAFPAAKEQENARYSDDEVDAWQRRMRTTRQLGCVGQRRYMLGRTIAESGDEDAGKVELCLVLRLYGAGRGRGVCVGVGHRSALRRRLRRETRTDGLARSAVAPMCEPAHGPERDTVGARGSRRALGLSSDVRSSGANLPRLQPTASGSKLCQGGKFIR